MQLLPQALATSVYVRPGTRQAGPGQPSGHKFFGNRAPMLCQSVGLRWNMAIPFLGCRGPAVSFGRGLCLVLRPWLWVRAVPRRHQTRGLSHVSTSCVAQEGKRQPGPRSLSSQHSLPSAMPCWPSLSRSLKRKVWSLTRLPGALLSQEASAGREPEKTRHAKACLLGTLATQYRTGTGSGLCF